MFDEIINGKMGVTVQQILLLLNVRVRKSDIMAEHDQQTSLSRYFPIHKLLLSFKITCFQIVVIIHYC